ncbi:MAG TPA: NAD-dependent epimerase/dehydratase family protein, partial [Solirubrobacteraceae bacterium]|nr:NAD-dependent epimerase/dehydratase family protein [Solirubrobacteraceae bacterium]
VVFHVAGVNEMCPLDPAPMYRANVQGAATVAAAAARAGVRRLVHTSSAAAIGEAAGAVGREDSPHRGSFLSHYERSKHEGELAVMAVARRTGLDVVSVNPSSVQGPGRAGGTAKIWLAVVDGRLPAVAETRMSIVDIDDCVAGHLLAETRGRAGERYLLSGATLTTREAVALVLGVAGIEEHPRFLPGRAVAAAGAVTELAFRALRRHPPLCREMVRTLRHGHAYDGSRATRELGLTYTPVRETVARTLQWAAREGLLRRPLPGLQAGTSKGATMTHVDPDAEDRRRAERSDDSDFARGIDHPEEHPEEREERPDFARGIDHPEEHPEEREVRPDFARGSESAETEAEREHTRPDFARGIDDPDRYPKD